MSYDPNHPALKGYLAIDKKAMLKAQAEGPPFDGKKACFVPDEKEGYLPADIVSSKGEEITVQVHGGTVSSTISLCTECEFMCLLNSLYLFKQCLYLDILLLFSRHKGTLLHLTLSISSSSYPP